jgi:VanZ family protein
MRHFMSRLRPLLLAACWLAALVAYVAAILPQQEAPHLGGSDKLDHMVAFFTVTVLARLAYPRASVIRLFVPIALFGGFIELSQMVPALHRDAEWADWFADMAASAFALLIATPIVHRLTRAGGSPTSDAS